MNFHQEMDGPRLIDIHCHILYGVDDGAADARMTRQILELAWRGGVRAMIATPHFRPDRWQSTRQQRRNILEEVRQMARELDPAFHVYPGSEIFYRDGITEALESGEAEPLADSRYVLVEFFPDAPYRYLCQGLQHLRLAGWQPILAHWERYECLLQSPERLEELTEGGVKIQTNAGAVLGSRGRRVKHLIRRLLARGQIDYVATDCHGSRNRPPQLKSAYEYIRDRIGEEVARRVCVENPGRILNTTRQE